MELTPEQLRIGVRHERTAYVWGILRALLIDDAPYEKLYGRCLGHPSECIRRLSPRGIEDIRETSHDIVPKLSGLVGCPELRVLVNPSDGSLDGRVQSQPQPRPLS